ncbi:MAG: site-specific DNA-methyltransferase [Bacteroidetes bacterium]|jgi:adenine-specific DNA-methyltransferase|nr:site-specific DNA-methyltransferase [Bacteroidota bacterium]
MPTLNWIGKDKVVNHHQDVSFKVLEHKYGFTAEKGEQSEETNSGNKIIQGDNLEALKSLLPEYEGRIKCIYIDPPYNTGNEKWIYNDNVNHPKIKKWLGEVVGKDGEDLTRHDKWLCMMYPRLKLLHKLLANDGAIFISIDDNEQASLKLMMNEIFGANKFIGQISWYKKRKGSFLSKEFISLTEYVISYRKGSKLNLFGGKPNSDESQPLVKRTNAVGILKFPANSVKTKLKDDLYPKGKYGKGSSSVELLNDIEIKDGVICQSFNLKGPFIWSQDFLDNEIKIGSQLVMNTKNFQPRAFRNSDDKFKGFPSFIDGREFSATNDDAYENLIEIFGEEKVFDYSKPYNYVKFIINSILHFDKNATILDSFAGSGTTAHSVLKLNEEDEGNRNFVLLEMEDYANDITAERVKRVMQGYGESDKKVKGLGGEFDYYQLGKPIFKDDKNLNEEIGEDKIREYIYYTETKQHLSRKREEEQKYFLDIFNETGYYFYYEKDKLTSLDIETLSIVIEKSEQYIIYADHCLLDPDYMLENNIIFKKIPRDIKRF